VKAIQLRNPPTVKCLTSKSAEKIVTKITFRIRRRHDTNDYLICRYATYNYYPFDIERIL